MKADGAKEYQYAVVQFLELPRANVGDYVCIPRSWIQMGTERKIRVAYPSERPSVTRKRIKAGESPSDDWKRYMAAVKFEAYTYKDANEFIKKKKYDALASNLSTSVVSNGFTDLSAAVTEKNSCSTKRVQKSEKNVKRIKVADRYELANVISSSSKPPESSNNEPTINDSPEKLVMDVTSYDVANDSPSCSGNTLPKHNQLFKYPYLQRIPELSFGIKNMSPEIGCEGSMRKPSNTTQDDPLDSIKKFFHDFPEPLKIQLPPDYLNQVLSQITNVFSQDNQISMSSPVFQDNGQVLPTGKVSVEQSACSTSADQLSVGEQGHSQGSDMQSMIVDERSKADIELNEQRTGSKSSAVMNSTENSGQSTGSSTEEKSLMIDKVATGDVSSTQDVDDVDDVDDDDDDFDDDDDDDNGRISPGVSIEETLGDNQSSSEQTDQSVESLMKKVDNRADQLTGLLKIMKIDFKRSSETALKMHKSYVRSIKVVEYMENAFDSIRKSEKDKVTVVRPKEVTANVQKVAEMKGTGKLDGDVEKGNEDKGNVRNQGEDDDGDEDKEASSKTSEHIRSFVLPAEYDPNDSRWTLKYRDNDPKLGLVELVPDSNVFVDPIQLAHCKRVSKDSKALARMLLSEIFTQSALSVCSLTGARANAFYSNGSDIRPGLDENARLVMLSYVEDYAREKKWGAYNGQSVINSLRSRIHEIRCKHGKTK